LIASFLLGWGMERFEWDEDKAKDNWLEHRITFEKATEVFKDPNAIIEPDSRYSYGEDRQNAIGMTESLLLLVVAHTYRERNDIEVTRIISARKAEPHERRHYGNRKLQGR